jgi:phosphate transport system protein
MTELQDRLNQLVLRLDRMGMRVEQAVIDALRAATEGDVQAGAAVDDNDSIVDREEVEIEQECVRLLALYQPAAVDLRTICTIIKVNSDLERIADLSASIGRRVKHVVKDHLDFCEDAGFCELRDATLEQLGRTVRMLTATDASTARAVINGDQEIDRAYGEYVRGVLDAEDRHAGGAEPAMTRINLAKALERIGDLCTNIAEDVIFLRTGDIVRHPDAFDGDS